MKQEVDSKVRVRHRNEPFVIFKEEDDVREDMKSFGLFREDVQD